jgi:hypothetical protein
MQLQHHVHAIAADIWPRGARVEVGDGKIFCKFANARAYDLVGAYSKSPHIIFMNCDKDDDFQRFVSAWGPLLWFPEDLKRGWSLVPLRDYRARRDLLRAVTKIMSACKGFQDERESLGEFITAILNMVSPGPTQELMKEAVSLDLIPSLPSLQQKGDPIKWAESASAADIRRVLASCVQDWFRSPSSWGFRVQARGKGFEIKPSFELHSLWDAMRWMLFFDEWNRRPPILCQECPKIFRPTTAHTMKFCSPTCAHRATNRVWRQKDLRKKRLDGKRKGGKSGTRKTR